MKTGEQESTNQHEACGQKPTTQHWLGVGRKCSVFYGWVFYYYFFVFVLFNIFIFVSGPQWKLLEFPVIVLSKKVIIIIVIIMILLKNDSIFILSPVVDLHITVCVCHDTNLVFLACSLMYQGLLPWNRSWTFPFLPGIVGQSIAT